MVNVVLNTSKEGTPEAMIRDLSAWRRIRKPSSFRTTVVPSPRCQPSQFIITAGEVVRESRLSYPRRIGWATGILG